MAESTNYISQCQDGYADESLLQCAMPSAPVAAFWQANPQLVVPRSYTRNANFSSACAASAIRGWPVCVRNSGGGLVPQGTGIYNLSMARVENGKPLDHAAAVYRQICLTLQKTLSIYGIAASPMAVKGSFCDGRFNLAIQSKTAVKQKIVGTAQIWRRIRNTQNTHQQVVLVHAVILMQVDCNALTQKLNAFEADLGTNVRYLPDSVRSISDFLARENKPQISVQAFAHNLYLQLIEQGFVWKNISDEPKVDK